jgi:hypothetical protein
LLGDPAPGTMAPMRWTEQKSEQFQALRHVEAQGRLTEEDRVALGGLLADLDADEAEALRPAGERLDAQARAMDAERADLDVKAEELERIAREEEGLLAEARAFVARLQQRSAALSEEDWRGIQETLYLLAVPGMRESIREGMETPHGEMSEEPGW